MNNYNCNRKFGDHQQLTTQTQKSKLQPGRQGEEGGVGRDGVAGLGDHLPPPPTHPRRF